MTRETIKQKVIELISELFKGNSLDFEVVDYIDLINDLGMDSITFITLIVEVEARFDITVPDDVLLMEHFRNVDNIVQIIIDQSVDSQINRNGGTRDDKA